MIHGANITYGDADDNKCKKMELILCYILALIGVVAIAIILIICCMSYGIHANMIIITVIMGCLIFCVTRNLLTNKSQDQLISDNIFTQKMMYDLNRK